MMSDLVPHWSHHAPLAVVDVFGKLGHVVVQIHGEAALTVHWDLQAGHLLGHFLRRLHEKELKQSTSNTS